MPQTGHVVGQYRLVRQIGEGGMGAVFEAAHTRIRSKRAAIKFLHPDFAHDPASVARFEREAEAAAAVGHEGIVDIYDLGQTSDGSLYMVMEYLEGESLKDKLKLVFATAPGASLDLDLTVFVACNVLSALGAAHRAGIVHRDLKPDNIFLVETGSTYPRVKLLDFGIARMMELGGSDQEQFTLTKTGTIMGTPFFMSPEQAQGFKDQIDQRTDLWSLGIILYACTTGQFPFQGENYNQLVARLVSDYEPVEPTVLNPEIPMALEKVILKSLRKELGQRYLSAEEMLGDLVPLANEATLSVLALSERRSVPRAALEDPATIPDMASPAPFVRPQHSPSGRVIPVTTPAIGPLQGTPGPGVVTNVHQLARRGRRALWPILLGLILLCTIGLAGGVIVLMKLSRPEADVHPTAPTPPSPSDVSPTKSTEPRPEPSLGIEAKVVSDGRVPTVAPEVPQKAPPGVASPDAGAPPRPMEGAGRGSDRPRPPQGSAPEQNQRERQPSPGSWIKLPPAPPRPPQSSGRGTKL